MRIADSVVVVTGASSGIGRATALALAGRGARVVLVARRADELAEVAEHCARRGAESLTAALDVTDDEAVRKAVEQTVERFGRLDGWVNCAGVTMFGTLLDVPLADVRRVLDVNLMGYVHGARAALPHMIAQEHGVLVNVSSILGIIAQPYGAAYTMSKFAIRGLSIALRQELRLAGVRGVAVATVLPAAIDTPIYAAAANRSGRAVRPPPPVYTAERVAASIVGQLERPRREVIAGGLLARVFAAQHTLLPALTERLLGIDVDRSLYATAKQSPGNLYEPDAAAGRVDGGWHGRRRERLRLAATLALAVTVVVGRQRHRSSSRPAPVSR